MSTEYTSETAPAGYVGPVKLTPEQRLAVDRLDAAWVAKMVAMARDEWAPAEDRLAAEAFLIRRGIRWES